MATRLFLALLAATAALAHGYYWDLYGPSPKKLAIMATCTPGGTPCDKGLVCKGGKCRETGSKDPEVVIGLTQGYYWAGTPSPNTQIAKGAVCIPGGMLCKTGLVCRDGMCQDAADKFTVAEKGKPCNGRTVKCAKGFFCMGPVDMKKCIQFVDFGQACGVNHQLCRGDLQCRDGKCAHPLTVVESGKACNGVTVICPIGLDCLGEIGKKRCVTVAKLNQSCTAKNTVCADDQACRKGVCVSKVAFAEPGKPCNGRDVHCKKPSFCIGPPTKMRCLKIASRGQPCSVANTLCSNNLECRAGKCAPPIITMAPGSACGGVAVKCGAGFDCIGEGGKKHCLKVVKLNEACGSSHTVCPSHLACQTGKCVEKAGVAGPGGTCNGGAIKCGAGFDCVGASGKQKCLKVVALNQDCSAANTACSGNLQCLKGKCSHPARQIPAVTAGKSCNGVTIKCADGLTCLGEAQKQICMKVVKLNEACGTNHAVCQGSLTCRGGKCAEKIVLAVPGGNCNGGTIKCETGFDCISASGKKKCLKTVKLNEACSAATSVCPNDLDCRAGKCSKKITIAAAGKPCDGATVQCGSLTCVKSEVGKRCMKLVSLNQVCASNFSLCRDPLVCRAGKCSNKLVVKATPGGSCNGDTIKCSTGFDCVGARGRRKCQKVAALNQDCSAANTVCVENLTCLGEPQKRCLRVVKLNEVCGTNHSVCPSNLTCRNGKCAMKVVIAVAGGTCNGDTVKCGTGFDCTGANGKKKCLKPAKLNQACSAAHTICLGDLECRAGKCLKKVTIAAAGKTCDGVTAKCGSTFTCVLSGGSKRCLKVAKLNEACGSNHAVCPDTLTCRSGKCTNKVVVVAAAPGGFCNGDTVKCGTGFDCVGASGKTKCLKVAALNQGCSARNTVCLENLQCLKGKCSHPVRQIPTVAAGNPCNGVTIKCTDGLTCLGESQKKRCLKVSKLNEVCGTNNAVCPSDLTCRSGKCANKVVIAAAGGPCNGVTINCATGFNCIAANGKQKCLQTAKLNEACGAAHIVCPGNLECRVGKCLKKITVAEAGKSCDGDTVKCPTLFTCVLSGGSKRCMKLVSLNQVCASDVTLCRDPLVCRAGKCANKIVTAVPGGVCNDGTIKCGTGFGCIGANGKKKCLKVVALNQDCSATNTVCPDDLQCRAGKCSKKMTIFQSRKPGSAPPGGSCNGENIKCMFDFACLGETGKKKCMRIVQLNQACGGGHTMCLDGLECRDGVCIKKIPTKVVVAAPGNFCNDSTIKCATGFGCIGAAGKKKCLKTAQLNGVCNTPNTVCSDDSECRGGKCAKKITIAEAGRTCDDVTMKCHSSFTCVSSGGTKVCLKVVALNQICGKDHAVCRDPLECRAGKCASKIVSAAPGRTCDGNAIKCGTGFECIGDAGKKKCLKPAKLSEPCSAANIVCVDDLECRAGKCSKKITIAEAGKACDDETIKCGAGFGCIGAAGKKKCLKTVKLNAACNTATHIVCSDDLDCRAGKCAKKITVAEPGKACDGVVTKCQNLFTCVLSGGSKRCMKLVALNDVCGRDNAVCRAPLDCRGGKCANKIVLAVPGETCNGATIKCGTGFDCIDAAGKKKCLKTAKLNEACSAVHTVCVDDLECRTGKCAKKISFAAAGGACNDSTVKCGTGFDCIGESGKKKCLNTAKLNEACTAAHTVCANDLECRTGKCAKKITIAQAGKACDDKTIKCPNLFTCLVSGGSKRCKKVVALNQVCGLDHAVCRDPLECRGGKCAKKVVIATPGGTCDGRSIKCGAGFDCIGGAGKKKCSKPAKLNESCSATNTVCIDDLECREGKCAKKITIADAGKVCDDSTIKCGAGFECIGATGKKTCLKPAKLNEACNAEHTVCSDDLECRNGKCAKKITTVEAGKPCDGETVKCNDKLTCLLSGGSKRCMKVVALNAICGLDHAVCRDPLECRAGKCANKIATAAAGATCNGSTIKCGTGFDCIGATGKKKCLKPAKLSQSCSATNTVCVDDLECRAGKCAKKITVAAAGSECSGDGVKCATGFNCTAVADMKRCLKVVALGDICSLDHAICPPDLVCRAGKCAKKVALAAAGASCDDEKVMCQHSFKCLKVGMMRKCGMLMSMGGFCGLSWTVCKPGLKCSNTRCVAAGPTKKMALFGGCNGADLVCDTGLSCVGESGKMTCVFLSKEGALCGIPGLACAEGLKCNGSGHGSRCVKA